MRMTAKLGEITLHYHPPVEIEKEIVALVRDKIGPVAAFVRLLNGTLRIDHFARR